MLGGKTDDLIQGNKLRDRSVEQNWSTKDIDCRRPHSEDLPIVNIKMIIFLFKHLNAKVWTKKILYW